MITRLQDLRHLYTIDLVRAGIVRIVEQSRHVGVLHSRIRMPENPRYQPDHSIKNNQGSQFAATENVVSY